MTDRELGMTTYAAARVTSGLGFDEIWVAAAGKSGWVRPAIRGDAFNMPSPRRMSCLTWRTSTMRRCTCTELHGNKELRSMRLARHDRYVLTAKKVPDNILIVTELGCWHGG